VPQQDDAVARDEGGEDDGDVAEDEDAEDDIIEIASSPQETLEQRLERLIDSGLPPKAKPAGEYNILDHRNKMDPTERLARIRNVISNRAADVPRSEFMRRGDPRPRLAFEADRWAKDTRDLSQLPQGSMDHYMQAEGHPVRGTGSASSDGQRKKRAALNVAVGSQAVVRPLKKPNTQQDRKR
jgi:hypothetical protein